jgi:low molecular weight protein-tyrosine phosphatase
VTLPRRAGELAPTPERERITFVCRANQARSPLAAELLANYLAQDGLVPSKYVISSAGTDVSASSTAMPHMRSVAHELGVDLSSHVARALDPADVTDSVLLIAMTEAQRGAISRLQPRAVTKTFTLKELGRLSQADPALPSSLGLEAVTTALHRRRAWIPASLDVEDIKDPVGLDLSSTEEVASEIDRLVKLVAALVAQA